MIVIGLDLGTTRSKTAATRLDTESGLLERRTFPTHPAAFLDLFRAWRPDVVAMEATASAGWVVDLCRAQSLRFLVAKTTDEAWRNRTTKTDRRDADLLARLAACGQLRSVHIPERDVREWRSLIHFRQRLVQARTRVKNHIKAILRQRDMATNHLWTARGLASVRLLSKPLTACDADEFWRGQLAIELQRLADAERVLAEAEKRLDAHGRAQPAVRELMDREHVGPRLAEAVVAYLDRPLRFHNRREVAAYVGLAPRIHQSCGVQRLGKISKAGSPVVRTLLVEVSWLAIRRDGWVKDAYQRLVRDDPQRRHKAVVGIARRLLIRCWAQLRDHERPRPTPLPEAA